MRQCFLCHKTIGKNAGNETVEHIPMKSLFEGYGSQNKVNRITVPCCFSCNNETSSLDEEFRNFIASISDNPILITMADKTIRSVLDYRNMFDRIYNDPETGKTGLLTPVQAVADYQVKVFKGLFYHKYKFPVPSEAKIKVDIDAKGNNYISVPYITYYNENFAYKHSGSSLVFRYILQPFRKWQINPDKNDFTLTDSDKEFVSIQVFNNCFVAVVYARLP
jgi:hypothetical protein